MQSVLPIWVKVLGDVLQVESARSAGNLLLSSEV